MSAKKRSGCRIGLLEATAARQKTWNVHCAALRRHESRSTVENKPKRNVRVPLRQRGASCA